jgi:hypothetical protein
MPVLDNALRVPDVEVEMLVPPRLFFTIHGGGHQNPRSVGVVGQFGDKMRQVFESPEKVAVPQGSVLVRDGDCRNQFSFKRTSDHGASWEVVVGERCSSPSRLAACARNAYGIFVEGQRKNFRERIDDGEFPWGPPAAKDPGPQDMVKLGAGDIAPTLDALNRGPDLVKAIAHHAYAKEFPKDSRISWLRVPPGPLGFSGQTMRTIIHATREFERACGRFILESERVRQQLLAGVVLPDERLRDVYVDPGVECFSVTRLDAHWNETGINISEIDEMPGGMPEIRHIDHAYGVNAEKWDAFFAWLFREGPLLFVVSHEWSKVYLAEVTWLVGHLQEKGYPAHLLTTDQLGELFIGEAGVNYRGERLGTIWRLFPIFEAQGMAAELVLAARRGMVRMVPEFAHFGNKTWFEVFWSNRKWYQANLDGDVFDLLTRILPESRMVSSAQSFPLRVGDYSFRSIEELAAVDQTGRDNIVLKVSGANDKASRSYGVLMGNRIKPAEWQQWIRDRLSLGQPFLVQKRFQTGIARIPVWNIARQRSEMFVSRLLMRPWAFEGTIVAVHGCAVPHKYHKVHGMSDMAVVPIVLE